MSTPSPALTLRRYFCTGLRVYRALLPAVRDGLPAAAGVADPARALPRAARGIGASSLRLQGTKLLVASCYFDRCTSIQLGWLLFRWVRILWERVQFHRCSTYGVPAKYWNVITTIILLGLPNWRLIGLIDAKWTMAPLVVGVAICNIGYVTGYFLLSNYPRGR